MFWLCFLLCLNIWTLYVILIVFKTGKSETNEGLFKKNKDLNTDIEEEQWEKRTSTNMSATKYC